MPLASLVLGLLSFVFMVAGLFTSMVPFVGSALSFGAPIVGIFGLVLGGVAMSRANRMGDSTALATAGMVVSGICFVLSLLFALTCGMCNACVSTAAVRDPNSPFNPNYTPAYNPPQPYNPPPHNPPPNNPPPHNPPQPHNPPPVTTSSGPPSTTCDEARECCLAFADGDETFCDSALSSGDAEACRHMMEGWAQGLRALGQDATVCSP